MNFLIQTLTLNYLKLLAIILASLIAGSVLTQVYISTTSPKGSAYKAAPHCPPCLLEDKDAAHRRAAREKFYKTWKPINYRDGKGF